MRLPRLVPRSTRVRVIIAVVAVLVGGATYWFWEEVVFVSKLAVPGPAFEGAENRTTESASIGDAVALPQVAEAPRPTGDDPSVQIVLLAELDSPSAVVDPDGDGPVLVATLDGRVHTVDLELGRSTVVADWSRRIDTGGERGLLGLALDPDEARIYANYSNTKGDNEIRSWPFEDGTIIDADDEGVLHLMIGQPFQNHNGGHLVFGPDDLLWIGTGDGGGAGDPGSTAQNPDNILGKMLRVRPLAEGGVESPSTNDAPGARSEVWGVGLRNPWRYSFDTATNRLWIADVGQTTIEEVSVADPDAVAANFGWSVVEGNNDYSGEAQDSFIAPFVTYDHSEGCSIAGGYVYRGEAAGLHGWYVYGDFCTQNVWAVPADDDTVAREVLATEVGQLLAFGQLDDGELLLLTREGIFALQPTG